jgi:ABC-type nitrate/sulfonate/bicarbonate transport system substrate-binding protein
MHRRVFLRGLAAAATAASAALGAACALPAATRSSQPKPAAVRTFKAAYLRLGFGGIEVTHQLGLLERKGWQIEWTAVDQISALVNVFSSGQVDIVDMAATIVGQMYEQGVKLRVFGAGVGTLGALLLGANSSVQSVPELRGRRVGGLPAGTTTQDINATVRKIHGLDLLTDTQFVPSTTVPDVVNLLTRGDVEAAFVWEPTTTQLVRSGVGRVLATQQGLWEQASGSQATEVHVVFMAAPPIVDEYPELLRDINEAQAHVAELWKQRDAQAVTAMQQVTTLPPEIIEEAFGRTSPLAGLDNQLIDTFLAQLRFNREYGTALQTDVWTQDAARVRNELFAVEHVVRQGASVN